MKVKRHIFKYRRLYMPVMLTVLAMAATAVAAFAQAPTSTLNISTSEITNNLFTGANVILGALLGVVMLIAGFRFGSQILDRLANAIKL